MNTISTIIRSLNRHDTEAAFADLVPDFMRIAAVTKVRNSHLLSRRPLTAGNDFHHLLRRMGDDAPLSCKESAYFPWVSALRRLAWGVGGWEMEIDADLYSRGGVPYGTCDLLVHGGPRRRGVIEAKVIVSGTQEAPRSRDLVQLASYARLITGRGSYDGVWAGLAYIELENRCVRLSVFETSRPLIARTLPLLRAA